MKKWLVAVIVASLGVGVGCETPESAEQQAADEQAADEQAEPQQAEDETEAGTQTAEKEDGDEHSAHQKAEKNAELPDDLADGQTGNYGGEFSVEGDPITLAAAIDKARQDNASRTKDGGDMPADGFGPYKVSASVEKVCKKKGCWFTLVADDTDQADVDEPVRVRMKDYSFFVPRNSDGANAVVEGMLIKRTVPQEEAQHYADDEVAGTDQEPEKIDGDQVQWEMLITAAKISKG